MLLGMWMVYMFLLYCYSVVFVLVFGVWDVG